MRLAYISYAKTDPPPFSFFFAMNTAKKHSDPRYALQTILNPKQPNPNRHVFQLLGIVEFASTFTTYLLVKAHALIYLVDEAPWPNAGDSNLEYKLRRAVECLVHSSAPVDQASPFFPMVRRWQTDITMFFLHMEEGWAASWLSQLRQLVTDRAQDAKFQRCVSLVFDVVENGAACVTCKRTCELLKHVLKCWLFFCPSSSSRACLSSCPQ